MLFKLVITVCLSGRTGENYLLSNVSFFENPFPAVITEESDSFK